MPHGMVKDDRLKNAKTSYRMWSDGQTIYIPKTQSTTKPQSVEAISALVAVSGAVRNGYFQPPHVDFTTPNNPPGFLDHFDLGIKRIFDDDFQISATPHQDFGLTLIVFYFQATFRHIESDGTLYRGFWQGAMPLWWEDDVSDTSEQWVSGDMTTYNNDVQSAYFQFQLDTVITNNSLPDNRVVIPLGIIPNFPILAKIAECKIRQGTVTKYVMRYNNSYSLNDGKTFMDNFSMTNVSGRAIWGM